LKNINVSTKVLECKLDNDQLSYGSLKLSDENIFHKMQFINGTHRVQRVPKTETKGRTHTSTSNIFVMPQFPESLKDAFNIKDCRVETKKSSGPGGQHANTTDSAVRILHIPTGLVIQNQDQRDQHANLIVAKHRLTEKVVEYHLNIQREAIDEWRGQNMSGLGRSDKILTYNFSQNRVTDHRVNYTS